MVTNAYINTTTYTQEQDLIGSLVVEAIQMHGQDFTYIPRTLVKEDTVFNEDTVSSFTSAYTIEMYIDSADGFEGEGEMLTQFGLQINEQIVTTVSASRFLAETSMPEPKVGDLIYLPLVDQVFEIMFVEDEDPFYQLGKLQVFKLTSEKFVWSHETVTTGVTEIDNNFTATTLVDSTVDNAVADDGLVPLSTTVTDAVIDFTTVNPFSEDY